MPQRAKGKRKGPEGTKKKGLRGNPMADPRPGRGSPFLLKDWD
jgi:hypothetical protein